jgi:hypothetical protein
VGQWTWCGLGESKQGHKQHISFFPDNYGFLLDLYHAFGCNHLNIYDSEWFFPHLGDYADGGIATFLTNEIKDVARKFKLDSKEHAAHRVCAGAADDMLLSIDSMDHVGVYIVK